MHNPLPGVPLVESPLFRLLAPSAGLSEEELRVATDLHERGYAVIDFPDSEIDARIDRIRARLSPLFGLDPEHPDASKCTGNQRIQDAWLFDEDVKAIVTNEALLTLLGRLYGRPAVPFQTLSFPVGTEQHLHSDSIHFSCIPERFMCGVWLAMEDVHPDAGALTYLPGSHRWPILKNIMIGRRADGRNADSAQSPFETAWRQMIDASCIDQDVFLARKGQALIWAANLLHGGSPRLDPGRTRWSQVSHYYFEDCTYYTPGHSDEAIGRLDLRTIHNIASGRIEPNRYLGEDFEQARAPWSRPPRSEVSWLGRLLGRANASEEAMQLPSDFDSAGYLQFNPDVAAAGHDPAEHFRLHGSREGRRYRI